MVKSIKMRLTNPSQQGLGIIRDVTNTRHEFLTT